MCSLFGVALLGETEYDPQIVTYATRLFINLGIAGTTRGIDAGGCAIVREKDIIYMKQGINPLLFFSEPILLQDSKHPRIIMGHTRKATVGDAAQNINNHPIVICNTYTKKAIIGCHNGSIKNHIIIEQDMLEHTNNKPVPSVDSATMFWKILHNGGVTGRNKKAIQKIFDGITGLVAATWLETEYTMTNSQIELRATNKIYILKQKKELYIVVYPEMRIIAWASTRTMFKIAEGLTFSIMGEQKSYTLFNNDIDNVLFTLDISEARPLCNPPPLNIFVKNNTMIKGGPLSL